MLHVFPVSILLAPRSQENERTRMENLAVVEELAGSDVLDELFKLNATESEPEDDEEEEDEEEEDEEEEDEEEEEDAEPGEMPH
jgi:hypothetical protein